MVKPIKKVKIDEDRCMGSGLCSMIAPEAFGFDTKKSKGTVKKDAIKSNHEKIREAAESCPTQAIILKE